MSAMHRPGVPEGVEVLLPPPLRFLLPPRDRSRGARRMGFDPDATVGHVVEAAGVLLTQDRRLLMRRALRRGALVRGSRPDDQLADVLDRFSLEFSPLTRCTACGGVLAPVDTAEVAHLLEPGTVRSYAEFVRCHSCRRVYWHGAHAARIDAI